MRGWMGWAAALGVAAAGCSGGEPARPAAKTGEVTAFQRLEAELLGPACVRAGCHGGEDAAASLDLAAGKAHRALVGVPAQRRPERVLVAPGDPGASYLVERLAGGGDSPVMPLGASPLTEAQMEQVRAWIRDGAKP